MIATTMFTRLDRGPTCDRTPQTSDLSSTEHHIAEDYPTSPRPALRSNIANLRSSIPRTSESRGLPGVAEAGLAIPPTIVYRTDTSSVFIKHVNIVLWHMCVHVGHCVFIFVFWVGMVDRISLCENCPNSHQAVHQRLPGLAWELFASSNIGRLSIISIR